MRIFAWSRSDASVGLSPTASRSGPALASASRTGSAKACSSPSGTWPICPTRRASASVAVGEPRRAKRSCGRCGQIVKAATSDMAPPSSTPGTRDSRAPIGAGSALATRKNSSTPFAPVATLRPIAVDSETHSATTNNNPAAAKVSADTMVPSATSTAAITVAST